MHFCLIVTLTSLQSFYSFSWPWGSGDKFVPPRFYQLISPDQGRSLFNDRYNNDGRQNDPIREIASFINQHFVRRRHRQRYVGIDPQNRIRIVSARIHHDELPRGRCFSQEVRRQIMQHNLTGDDAGHIIARSLGGLGGDRFNGFQQNSNVRRL